MVRDDEAGSSGRPDGGAGTAELSDDSSTMELTSPPNLGPVPGSALGDDGLPTDLTVAGRAEFARLVAVESDRFKRDLGHELSLHWLSLNLTGPATFTVDDVRQAYAAMLENERRRTDAEVQSRLRTANVAELQQAKDQRAVQVKRAGRRWAAGSVLVNANTTTIAVMAVAGGSLWLKVLLVASSVIGTLITRPSRG